MECRFRFRAFDARPPLRIPKNLQMGREFFEWLQTPYPKPTEIEIRFFTIHPEDGGTRNRNVEARSELISGSAVESFTDAKDAQEERRMKKGSRRLSTVFRLPVLHFIHDSLHVSPESDSYNGLRLSTT